MGLADVVDLLACPACASRDRPDEPVRLDGPSLRCAHGHAYDVARQGYVNLLAHAAPANADTPAMVAARARFLGTGAYDRIGAALAETAVALAPGPAVLDVGSGPGWYLARVLDSLEGAGRRSRGLALDVSPAAARRAARSGEAVGAVVADAWARLPVRTGAVDVVLSVFAPRQPAELARVLTPGGVVLVVTPLPDHLAAQRTAWGLLEVEPGKQERLAASFGGRFEPVQTQDVRSVLELDASTAHDLVAMGPNAFHTSSRSDDPPPEVEVAVRVDVWRRNPRI